MKEFYIILQTSHKGMEELRTEMYGGCIGSLLHELNTMAGFVRKLKIAAAVAWKRMAWNASD
eukprot:7249031-Ditylum_brightwellii.AAC.1